MIIYELPHNRGLGISTGLPPALTLCRALRFADRALIVCGLACLGLVGLTSESSNLWLRAEAFIAAAAFGVVVYKRPWNILAASFEVNFRTSVRDGNLPRGALELSRWHAAGVFAVGSTLVLLAALAEAQSLAGLAAFALVGWWGTSAHAAVERGTLLEKRWWWLHVALTPGWYGRELAQILTWLVRNPGRVATWLTYWTFCLLTLPLVVVSAAMSFGQLLFRAIPERLKWARETCEVTVPDMLGAISDPNHGNRRWILEAVYQRRRLAPTEHSERSLERLGVIVLHERAQAHARRKKERLRFDLREHWIELWRSFSWRTSLSARRFESVDGWAAACRNEYSECFAHWSETVIDLVWRLVDQVHLRRAGEQLAQQGSVDPERASDRPPAVAHSSLAGATQSPK